MKNELVLISGKELKDIVKSLGFTYFNGYKFYLTEEDLSKLEDNRTYVMFVKYGMLFVKPLYAGKSVIVKKGEKVPKKRT